MSLQKILYVEDEPDIRMVGQLSLGTVGGFAIELCEHGGLVEEAARRFQPDLVLMDVMMPTMDGPTALARLKADPALAHIPVVFMTAKVQRHEVEQYLAQGALDVIAKPFDPMTLPDQVRSIWGARAA